MPYTEYQNSIKRSEFVILIGYSLPLYNRQIDSALLEKAILKGKRLIIQDANPISIQSILKSDFGIYSSPKPAHGDLKIDLYEDCQSFIVPNTSMSFDRTEYHLV